MCDDHPATARRINNHQRWVTWDRPQRPDWMSKEIYAEQPATVEIRLVDIQVLEPGFRTQTFPVATTTLNHKLSPATGVGSLYRHRWPMKLDIRSIRCPLGMDVTRDKNQIGFARNSGRVYWLTI